MSADKELLDRINCCSITANENVKCDTVRVAPKENIEYKPTIFQLEILKQYQKYGDGIIGQLLHYCKVKSIKKSEINLEV